MPTLLMSERIDIENDFDINASSINERFEEEEKSISSQAEKINIRITHKDHEGIRCLTLFPDAKPTEETKKLNELLRRERFYSTPEEVSCHASSYFDRVYPLTHKNLYRVVR